MEGKEEMDRIVFRVMLVLLLIGMSTLTFNVQLVKAKTIIVPDNYSSIQIAINAAEDGDVI
jgi:hypothetical protein